MLEDSISSSPSKSNKSIRETRLKRKIKRNQLENNEANKSDRKITKDLHSFINDFYLDSDDESNNKTTFLFTKTTAIVNNYKPFELEKSLAIADRLAIQQPQRIKTNCLLETEGFVSCTKLTQLELENCTTGSSKERYSSFGITESEMINCCNIAEQNLQLTPKKDEMCLVNSILEDFSQSPLDKQTKKQQSPCQHTPEFRLRRKPMKTYSRTFLNRSKRNLNERFMVQEQHLSSSDEDDDDGRSSTSSLSIQEDVTMGEASNNQTTVANLHNTRLCENLLNLSVYFTQNQSQDNVDLAGLSDKQEEHIFCSNVAYLIKDIIALRSMYIKSESCDTFGSADFLGFHCESRASVNGNIDVDSTEHNSIHTTLNMTQDMNIHNDRHLEISINGEDWNDEDCEDIFACINTENILDHQNFQQSNAVETNDEFILPLHSVHKIENEIPVNKICFTTASSNPIKVSRESHIMAAKILSKLPEIPSLQNEVNIKDCDNKSLKDNNIFENLEDDEWNDDCDLLLNFQTPTVINENLTIKTQNTKSEWEVDSRTKVADVGFQTAGGKNVVISRKAQESVKNLLSEFDIELEDNLNCEEILKEMKSKVYAKTHNLEKKETTAKESGKEVIREFEILCDEAPSASKIATLGFQTAGGKNVHISRSAQESVQNLLKEFDNDFEDNYNCEEALKDMKSKVYRKSHKLLTNVNQNKLQTSSVENFNVKDMNSIGFKTAGGKNVDISKKAQESVQKLLKEFSNDVVDDYNYEEKLKEIKNQVYSKTHNFEYNQIINNEGETTTLNKLTKTEGKYKQFEFEGPSTSKMASLGVQTALGKNITITKKAQESVNKLLQEFSKELEDYNNCEEKLKEIKNKVYAKTHNLETQSTKECGNIKNIIEKEESATNLGFTTAKGNKIVTSAKAQESVTNLLKDFDNDTSTNYLNELELAKNEIYNKNNKLKMKEKETSGHNEDFSGIMLSEWPLEKSAEKEIDKDLENVNTNKDFQDFQTANGQQVVVSTKAQHMADNLLQVLNTDMDVEKYENDLINMKTKIQHKIEEHKPETSQEQNELALSSQELTPKNIKGKRKYSIDNSELTSPGLRTSSTPAKLQNTGVNNSRSSLVEQSLKSPLTLAANSVIVRRNLSLTKRLRNKRTATQESVKINNEDVKLIEDIVTPIKSCIKSRITNNTPNTPNLKEFFSEAALTSTPRLNQATTSASVIDEKDFKPINWKNNESVSNKSANNHTTKLSDNSAMNISINSTNPTAKERIGRLKMYGKAPPVSPILIETHHNCRPSGLRRTRSMLKNKEK